MIWVAGRSNPNGVETWLWPGVGFRLLPALPQAVLAVWFGSGPFLTLTTGGWRVPADDKTTPLWYRLVGVDAGESPVTSYSNTVFLPEPE